eukprot:TRINITY_DN36004_c0_g1_i1.p1 TRINITY_DN36004_c0_g1~~TRINITY_DN36004_c0_g1_i1.p1  ORF type:complete len:625 (+),score=136.40 TRINITY_DN36004_c0_g1_i1:36-1877(+)
MKYVVVTGGVVSGLGKGITASSIGLLLKCSGMRVTSIKIDPYLNVDAGTMSPYEHGEVYVLDDGGEADLDLGNYERFLDVNLTRDHNITTGKVYDLVIQRERRGDYLGKTVQVVPHITDAVQDWIERVSVIPVDGSKKSPEACIIELGGTVGDIESMVFLEALRQFAFKVGRDNFCHVHVSLVPTVGAVGEPKSKPTQHSVRELRAAGLSPDIIVCRSGEKLDRSVVQKISQFCMVPWTHVLSVHDVPNLYHVPLLMLEQGVTGLILNTLRVNKMPPESLPEWENLVKRVENAKQRKVKIGLVGKYTGLSDSYLSVLKALHHAAIEIGVLDVIQWIDSAKLEPQALEETPEEYEKAWTAVKSVDGILIPGGFGGRGVEGKILAANYARTKKIPFLGICLGLQVAVAEFSRNVVGWKGANSTEFDEHTEHPVVIYMPEVPLGQMGGTMRLGSRCTKVKSGTMAYELYSKHEEIYERHRHRYEVNPEKVAALEENGLIFSGKDVREARMEIIELPADQHPFYFATQFHPEFQSRPMSPSPPFLGLIQACSKMFVRIVDDDQKSVDGNQVSSPPQSAANSASHLTKPKRRSVQSKALTPPAMMNEDTKTGSSQRSQ